MCLLIEAVSVVFSLTKRLKDRLRVRFQEAITCQRTIAQGSFFFYAIIKAMSIVVLENAYLGPLKFGFIFRELLIADS